MAKVNARLAGVELYFESLPAAKQFYEEILDLRVMDETGWHHVQFDGGSTFLCLEAKGAEDYPSLDKAVIFLEVPSLREAVDAIGDGRIIKQQPRAEGHPAWAVLHDPEGHNVLLLKRLNPQGPSVQVIEPGVAHHTRRGCLVFSWSKPCSHRTDAVRESFFACRKIKGVRLTCSSDWQEHPINP